MKLCLALLPFQILAPPYPTDSRGVEGIAKVKGVSEVMERGALEGSDKFANVDSRETYHSQ